MSNTQTWIIAGAIVAASLIMNIEASDKKQSEYQIITGDGSIGWLLNKKTGNLRACIFATNSKGNGRCWDVKQ